MGLVYFHNQNRARDETCEGNIPLGWLRQGKLALYLMVTFLYGFIIFAPRVAFPSSRLAELPLVLVVVMHYYIDGRLWRFSLYPERGRFLRLFSTRVENPSSTS